MDSLLFRDNLNVTCTCRLELNQYLDSGKASQEGSSSFQDGPGTAYQWSTDTHTQFKKAVLAILRLR